MRGRDFFKWVGAVTFVIIILITLPIAGLAAEISLKLGHVQPTGTPYDEASMKFAERIAANTKGRVEIKVFNNSQLGSPQEHWAQLKIGAIDLHVTDVGAASMIEPKPKNLDVMTAPYIFESQADIYKFLRSDLFKTMMAKVEKSNNMKYIGYIGDRAPRGFSTTSRRVTAPDEMKGLKLRVPELPIFVATYKAWGANPTPIVTREIYTSLKSGMVDGIDWDIISIYSAKYHEIQKYYTAIDWMRSSIGCFINAKKWDSFPEEMKKTFVISAQETEFYINDYTMKSIAEAEKAFKAAGIEIIHPDLNRWKELAEKETLNNEGKFWGKGLYYKIKALK